MTGALIIKPFDTVIPIEQIKFYPSDKNKKYILINKTHHMNIDYDNLSISKLSCFQEK